MPVPSCYNHKSSSILAGKSPAATARVKRFPSRDTNLYIVRREMNELNPSSRLSYGNTISVDSIPICVRICLNCRLTLPSSSIADSMALAQTSSRVICILPPSENWNRQDFPAQVILSAKGNSRWLRFNLSNSASPSRSIPACNTSMPHSCKRLAASPCWSSLKSGFLFW